MITHSTIVYIALAICAAVFAYLYHQLTVDSMTREILKLDRENQILTDSVTKMVFAVEQSNEAIRAANAIAERSTKEIKALNASLSINTNNINAALTKIESTSIPQTCDQSIDLLRKGATNE